ncbi:MAG: glycosyltransferase family 1 protein [Candidatus Nanopelagicales bacterium]
MAADPRPTVLLVVFTDVSQDPRVMRHVAALAAGFRVVTCGKGPPPPGVHQHLRIPDATEHLPMTPLGLAALASRRAELAYRQLPAARVARELLADVQFDVAIANDINTLPVVLEVAGTRPVIADLHEYAPREMEEDWRWRLMIQPWVSALCRKYLVRAAGMTTVAEGIAAEYRAQFGVTPQVVTNAGAYRAPAARPVGSPIRAVHTGIASPNRQLEKTIAAAADLPGLTLDLYLVSSVRARSHLGELSSQAGATSNVRVLDPVPMPQIPQTLDAYDLGVFVLDPINFNYAHALPNKLFDFVQSGLGVVIGPSPEMAALVRRHSLGEVLPDFSAEALRSCLASLTRDQVAGWKSAACGAARDLSAPGQAETLRAEVARVLVARA